MEWDNGQLTNQILAWKFHPGKGSGKGLGMVQARIWVLFGQVLGRV